MNSRDKPRRERTAFQSDFVNRMPSVLHSGSVHWLIAPAGSGKSLAVAAVVADGIHNGWLSRVLILAPGVLVQQSVVMLAGEGVEAIRLDPEIYRLLLERSSGALVTPKGVFAVSIDFAKRPDVAEQLAQVPWDLVIVDEAQLLSGQRAELMRLLSARDPATLLVSATSPSLDSEWLRVNSITDWRPAVSALWRAQLDQVGRLMERQVLRYRRGASEVEVYQKIVGLAAQLPPFKGRMALRLAASSPGALEAAVERWVTSPDIHPEDVGDLLDLVNLLDDLNTDAHLAACLELIREQEMREGGHAVVFCEFVETAKYVATAVAERGVRSYLIHGSLGAGEQDTALREYQSRGGVLVTTSAGKWGNLDFVTLAIHYDAPRSVERFLEREARYWRLGRSAPCTTVFLVDSSGALPVSDFVDWLMEGGADFLDEIQSGSLYDELTGVGDVAL